MKRFAKCVIAATVILVPLTGAMAAKRNVYFRDGKVIATPAANAKTIKDCVKIPCPEGWKPTTVCWDCKDRPSANVYLGTGGKVKRD